MEWLIVMGGFIGGCFDGLTNEEMMDLCRDEKSRLMDEYVDERNLCLIQIDGSVDG